MCDRGQEGVWKHRKSKVWLQTWWVQVCNQKLQAKLAESKPLDSIIELDSNPKLCDIPSRNFLATPLNFLSIIIGNLPAVEAVV